MSTQPQPIHVRSLESASDSRSDRLQSAVIHQSHAKGEILQIFGEVDLASVDELRTAIDRAAKHGPDVIVDLTTCTYLDSTILSVLIMASQTYAGRLQIVVPPSGIVRRVFAVTSLLDELPVVDSLEAIRG